MHGSVWLAALMAVELTGAAAKAQAPTDDSRARPAHQGTQLDLAQAFHARSAWRLVLTEGSGVKDYADNDAPGALTLCLRKGPAKPCVSDPVTPPLAATPHGDPAWEPHYLFSAKLVYPQGSKAAPLLLIVTGSLNSGDGDQIVATQLVAYDPRQDVFRSVYAKSVGHNNNQEVRFITKGPLQGGIISAEPQEHAPYGFWVVVSRLTPAGAYRQALRYRSATLYNDGNTLAVIDSEMPNIESRLGLWRPGQPLPTPDVTGDGKPCLKPTLRHTELWCR